MATQNNCDYASFACKLVFVVSLFVPGIFSPQFVQILQFLAGWLLPWDVAKINAEFLSCADLHVTEGFLVIQVLRLSISAQCIEWYFQLMLITYSDYNDDLVNKTVSIFTLWFLVNLVFISHIFSKQSQHYLAQSSNQKLIFQISNRSQFYKLQSFPVWIGGHLLCLFIAWRVDSAFRLFTPLIYVLMQSRYLFEHVYPLY